MLRFVLSLIVAVTMLFATVASAFAGSLLRGQELTIQSDGSGTLEKVCQSTTEHGDAVTHADAGGLSTSTTEDCSI